MGQLKDERRMKEIFDRGAPYPWDFWESSESEFAGRDYETYWDEEPHLYRLQTEARTTRNYW